jgi:hypothetical protein
MLMLSVATIAGFALSNQREPPAVPAVAIASPSPQISQSPPVRTAPTGSPTGQPRSPTPAPQSVPPTAAPATQPEQVQPLPDSPMAAFRERMVRGDSSYHLDMDGSMQIGNERMALVVSLDVAGADFEGTMKIKQDRVRVTADLLVVDGVQYTRPSGGEWLRVEGPAEDMPGDVFSSIGSDGWDALEYVGPVKRDGARLHHLRVPLVDWQRISSGFLDGGRSGLTIRSLRFDIWVTKDGKPRQAKIAFDGTVREGIVEVDMTYDFDYRFSRFGDPFEIRPPTRFTDPDKPQS